MGRDVTARFWDKVERHHGAEECWPWTASTFAARGGYGKFQAGTSRSDARAVYAHRHALELRLGRKLVGDECALHTCDNPVCCNPNHLWIGTRADNLADMHAKGRYRNQYGPKRSERGGS